MSEPTSELAVPEVRVRALNDAGPREDGDYVLYWMTALRRPRYNFALQRAAFLAGARGVPLVVFEPLRCDHPWASDRIHRFVIEGMLDNARALAAAGVPYLPYTEPSPDAGSGLLEALADRACVVVGDDYPAFFLPRMLAAAAGKLRVRLEAVDGNGLLPLRAADRTYPSAYTFRRFLHRELPEHLEETPLADPLTGLDPVVPGAGWRRRMESLGLAQVLARWPSVLDPETLAAPDLSRLPIAHDVRPVDSIRGGLVAAGERLEAFLEQDLARYGERRSDIADECSSRLSPWLHFGHLSAHEVMARIAAIEDWSPADLSERPTGKRGGWWNLSEGAETFLDELVTWRELGFNMCWQRDDYTRYESLPEWAQRTLAEHAGDARPHLYSLDRFEAADTHDELWNAAQGQLLSEGRIHNYLRMLWGKKILHWSASPQEALEIMIELNNKYALDGRDPNSYSGIFWCLGRYDRPWGPEREVFGKVRFMTSASTRRKYAVDAYVERFASVAARG